MTLSHSFRFALTVLNFSACFMGFVISGKAQVKQRVKKPVAGTATFSWFTDSLSKSARPARLPAIINNGMNRPTGITATCNTSTFYMHLTATAGKKINLREIQTMTDGNYLLAGNVTLPNAEQEGLLCALSNAGAVISQKQVRINNRPTTLFNIKTMMNGQVAMAGIVHETTDQVFVALLNSDLSVNWLKTVAVTGPVSTALDVVTDNKLYVAVQTTNAVNHFILDSTGLMGWSKMINITGLDSLAGIGHNGFSELTLSLNCTSGGKKQVQLFTADEASGNILSAGILGDGTAENITGRAVSFNNRIITTGITKTNTGQFQLSRQIMFNAVRTETLHTYNLPATIDFNITSAQDNAGDVMGFCFPATGKLLFLRHFAGYQVAPEHSVTYNVPAGSTIAGVTRSMNDGGYLFALNTIASGESILIKTDSIGTLAGCNYQSISINYTENINVPNTTFTITSNTVTGNPQAVNVTENSVSLLTQFDCNQSYCPTLPPEDTCLASYFKTYRSNSYVGGFGTYGLMRNNRHLLVTSRLDRTIGDMNSVSYGLALYEENGSFIKGITVFHGNNSVPMEIKKVDDQHVLLMGYSSVAGNPNYTFTLVNDNLQIIWSRSLNVTTGSTIFANGLVTTDKDGNIYVFSQSGGYFENTVKVGVHKMDAAGNSMWTKLYDVQATHLLGILATTTNTSLILVAEGPDRGSISLNINKVTGELLNVYHYESNSGNYATSGLLKFENDRIMYAGTTRENNFVMGIFDTTGKPVKFAKIPELVGLRATTARDNKLYALCDYFNGVETKELLIKADSSLSFDFINEFDFIRPGYPSGMEISDAGNIYAPGNYFFGGANSVYVDATLRKFDTRGLTGICNYRPRTPITSNINLQTTAVGFTTLPDGIMVGALVPVSFIPDANGNQVGELVCSSTTNCNSITLTGSNKVCQLNQPFIFKASRNAGCIVKPGWLYDTAFVVLQMVDDTTAEIKFKKTGSTWIKLQLNAGCSFSADSMLVQVQSSPAVFSLGNDTAICKGSSIVLNAGGGFNSYRWQDGSSNPAITVTQPGVFFVTVDNVCGNVYTDTINVQLVNMPVLNIGIDTSICTGDTLHLNASAGFNQYTWKPAASITGQGVTVGIYTLQNIAVTAIATTTEGCQGYDTLALSIKTARPVLLGNDTGLCTGDSLMLSAGAGYLQYTWSTGAVSAGISVQQAGTYSVIATDINGCKAKDTLQLQLYPLPKPMLGNDFNICKGSQRQLDVGNFNRYLWQDGSTGRYFNASTAGSYWVQVADVHSCTASDSIRLINLLPLPADFLKAADSICQFEKITISSLKNFTSYLWSTGSIQPSITADAPGLYTLRVTDGDGCAGTDSILIRHKDCLAGVLIPTAFTPNRDSRNDVFKATVHGNLLMYRLEIFNRFGEIVFSTNDPQKGWDGTHKGSALPAAAYTWQCFYQFAGQFARYSKGSLVMIR